MEISDTFGERIDARDRLERDRADLLELLQDLDHTDWERTTAAAPWVVRDVVAHVLGDDLARLARGRDGHSTGGPRPGEAFASFIHRINDQWVGAAARISPALLVDLLGITSAQMLEFWRGADLDALAEPVSWVGPEPAPVWLDCARDYTEYWVHQQQIRDATGRDGRQGPEMVHCVLDTFLRAMPSTLAGHSGDQLTVEVGGAAGGRWTWRGRDGDWTPSGGAGGGTVVTFPDAESLWCLCTRMITPDRAGQLAGTTGSKELGEAALQIVSIIR